MKNTYGALLQQPLEAFVIAVMARVASGINPGPCRWWRFAHDWVDHKTRSDASGHIRYRRVFCRRCDLLADVDADGAGHVWRSDTTTT